MAATKGNKTSNWKSASLEVVGIVFAVLLALWLESLRDDMELQDRADEALERIRYEIVANKRDLEESIASNQENITAIRAVFSARAADPEAATEPLLGSIVDYLAFSSSSLSDSAWTSAKMTEVLGKMPPETVSSLAGLYDTQSYYRDYARIFVREYAELTIDIQLDKSADEAARKFVQHAAILNSIGSQLLEAYNEFLGADSPGDTPPAESR